MRARAAIALALSWCIALGASSAARAQYGAAPTVIHERGDPKLWVTGLGLFAGAYLVPPIVALGIEGRTRSLELPFAGWIVFLANQDCPESMPGAGADASAESECTLASIGVVWSGVLQLAGLGLFIAGLLVKRTIRVVTRPGPAFAFAPMVVPGGGGVSLAWQ